MTTLAPRARRPRKAAPLIPAGPPAGGVPYAESLVMRPSATISCEPKQRERMAAQAAGKLSRALHRPVKWFKYGGISIELTKAEETTWPALLEQVRTVLPIACDTIIRHVP